MRPILFFIFSFWFISCFAEEPRISIITSLYNGEKFIEGFMKDIVRQTVFDQCELIIINANSPENERPFIREYLEKYPNIFYFELVEDPGLYAVWNLGIQIAQGEYITNANVDDRLSPICYEIHAKTLDENQEVDLVYSDFFWTERANETFEKHSAKVCSVQKKFSRRAVFSCMPGPNPMWRKTMHTKYGLFDESFRLAGDWEMWCRAVAGGAIFKKVDEILCLFYKNPNGLSTDHDLWPEMARERQRIIETYNFLWRKT